LKSNIVNYAVVKYCQMSLTHLHSNTKFVMLTLEVLVINSLFCDVIPAGL